MAAIAQQVVGSGIGAVGDVMKEVGQAINPGQVPQQMNMDTARLGINVEETIYIKDRNGINEVFMLDQLDMTKLCQMICCPVCCTFVPLTSENRKMEYQKICGLCSCKWAVNIDERMVGGMKDVGCCENGCMFCCCPCFVCDGYAKVMGMVNANQEEKFVFTSKLFPCWPLVGALGLVFAGFGLLGVSMQGCYNYVNGTSVKTITQPVYAGPWKRGTNPEPPKQIGTFHLVQRFTPCGLCCACPTPMRAYYKATTPEGANITVEDHNILTLVLALYRGLPVPCKCLSPAGFRSPTGIPCLDIGLQVEEKWSSPKQVLMESK